MAGPPVARCVSLNSVRFLSFVVFLLGMGSPKKGGSVRHFHRWGAGGKGVSVLGGGAGRKGEGPTTGRRFFFFSRGFRFTGTGVRGFFSPV